LKTIFKWKKSWKSIGNRMKFRNQRKCSKIKKIEVEENLVIKENLEGTVKVSLKK